MKLFDIFKPKPKEEPNIEQFTIPRFTTKVRTDDEVIELPNDKILNDGTCLVAENGKYYHLHVGCYAKWSVPFTGWKMMKVSDAKKEGLDFCLICNDEIRERER